MKIRTKEQLCDFLDTEMAWRKKELTTLKSNIQKSSTKLEDIAIRTGLVLLYAHWEGFIKNALTAYLEFVISRRLKYKEISLSFMALALKQKIREFEQTNKATIHTQIIDYIVNCNEEKVVLNKDSTQKTGSNLSSLILREMLTSVGLEFTPYDTKSNLIDEQLLYYRNNVAHGNYLLIDAIEYFSLHDNIRIMLDQIKSDIVNAVLLAKFER